MCAKEWTNYNPSDPGITLLEVFAHLTDLLLYRANRVSDRQMVGFLKLLNGHSWRPELDRFQRVNDMRSALADLRRIHRGVTAADWELLALNLNKLPDTPRIARVKCVPSRNLSTGNADAARVEAPGHVSLVVVLEKGEQPPQDLLKQVHGHLESARLLSTRLHVVGPLYVHVQIRVTIAAKPDANPGAVRDAASKALVEYFDPLRGGPQGEGWEFGRDVFVSDVYEVLYRVPGVLYATKTMAGKPVRAEAELAAGSDSGRLLKNNLHQVEGVDLWPGELPRITAAHVEITMAGSQNAI